MTQIDCGRFQARMRACGLLFEQATHDEHFVFRLCGVDVITPNHPESVRRMVEIAREVSGEGLGVHAELLGLYAKREELDDQSGETRVIAWKPYEQGPSLEPDRWVKLGPWLDDQFLYEDAMLLFGPDDPPEELS